MNKFWIWPIAAGIAVSGASMASAASVASFESSAFADVFFTLSGDGEISYDGEIFEPEDFSEGTATSSLEITLSTDPDPVFTSAEAGGEATSPGGVAIAGTSVEIFGTIEALTSDVTVTVDYALGATGSASAFAMPLELAGAFAFSGASLFISGLDPDLGDPDPILDAFVFGGSAEASFDLFDVFPFPTGPYDESEAPDAFDFLIPAGSFVEFSADVLVEGLAGVAPVPLPASGLLLLGGLAAFGAAGRRRRS